MVPGSDVFTRLKFLAELLTRMKTIASTSMFHQESDGDTYGAKMSTTGIICIF